MDNLINNRRPGCKGCYPVFKLPTGDIYDLLVKGGKKDIKQYVEKGVYEQRIKACENCDGLMASTTCRFSGNLVFQNAAKTDQKCFYPGDSKW
ncbi:MAG: hypothetical protein ACLFPF_05855 [Halanaerobiales bacterium]